VCWNFVVKEKATAGSPFFCGVSNRILKATKDINVLVYKLKCSRYRPGVAQRVGRGIDLLFHDRGTGRG